MILDSLHGQLDHGLDHVTTPASPRNLISVLNATIAVQVLVHCLIERPCYVINDNGSGGNKQVHVHV